MDATLRTSPPLAFDPVACDPSQTAGGTGHLGGSHATGPKVSTQAQVRAAWRRARRHRCPFPLARHLRGARHVPALAVALDRWNEGGATRCPWCDGDWVVTCEPSWHSSRGPGDRGSGWVVRVRSGLGWCNRELSAICGLCVRRRVVELHPYPGPVLVGRLRRRGLVRSFVALRAHADKLQQEGAL